MSRVLRTVFASIRKSLFPAGRQASFVGTDQYGNRYFELLEDKERNLRGSRYIEEPNDQFRDQFEQPTIPVEWESWLRRKRQDPPSEEEIQRNYARMIQTKLRAQELEKGFKTKEIESTNTALPITEDITPDSHQSQFPTYPEFEAKPGQKFKS